MALLERDLLCLLLPIPLVLFGLYLRITFPIADTSQHIIFPFHRLNWTLKEGISLCELADSSSDFICHLIHSGCPCHSARIPLNPASSQSSFSVLVYVTETVSTELSANEWISADKWIYRRLFSPLSSRAIWTKYNIPLLYVCTYFTGSFLYSKPVPTLVITAFNLYPMTFRF